MRMFGVGPGDVWGLSLRSGAPVTPVSDMRQPCIPPLVASAKLELLVRSAESYLRIWQAAVDT